MRHSFCLIALFICGVLRVYAQNPTDSIAFLMDKGECIICGDSDAKDCIQRHTEAIVHAIDKYARSMPMISSTMKDKDGNVQSSFDSDGKKNFNLEIVDISFQRDCESVAIRIEDGEDYHIQLAEENHSSSNGIENRTVMMITSTVSPENTLQITYQDPCTNTVSSTEVSLHFVETLHKDVKQQGEMEFPDEFKKAFKEQLERYRSSER